MMMAALEYIISISKQATRATLKDTNLNTFMIVTTKITDKISEKIQFWPANHQPNTTGMLDKTPKMSIMRIEIFLIQNFFCRQEILRKKSSSIAMIDQEAIIEATLAMLRTILKAQGAYRLRSPTMRMLEVTRAIILYPYSMPYPPKAFHLPTLAAKMSISVAKKMRMIPPYSKYATLQVILQLRLYEKLPSGAILSVMISKQLVEVRREGQLLRMLMVQVLLLQDEALSWGWKLLYCVLMERSNLSWLDVMVIISGELDQYYDLDWAYEQRVVEQSTRLFLMVN